MVKIRRKKITDSYHSVSAHLARQLKSSASQKEDLEWDEHELDSLEEVKKLDPQLLIRKPKDTHTFPDISLDAKKLLSELNLNDTFKMTRYRHEKCFFSTKIEKMIDEKKVFSSGE